MATSHKLTHQINHPINDHKQNLVVASNTTHGIGKQRMQFIASSLIFFEVSITKIVPVAARNREATMTLCIYNTHNNHHSSGSEADEQQGQQQQEQERPMLLGAERFMCPITCRIMKDPVTSPNGISFERKAILRHLKKKGQVCPVTNETLRSNDLVPNSKLQWEILYWQRKNTDTTVCSTSMAPPPPPACSPPFVFHKNHNQSGHCRDSSPTAPTRESTASRSSSSSSSSSAATPGTPGAAPRRDSFCDLAPRQPRRSSRCDKTLSLDTSIHDASPSVPQRRSSEDNDSPDSFLRACQASLMASSTTTPGSSCCTIPHVFEILIAHGFSPFVLLTSSFSFRLIRTSRTLTFDFVIPTMDAISS